MTDRPHYSATSSVAECGACRCWRTGSSALKLCPICRRYMLTWQICTSVKMHVLGDGQALVRRRATLTARSLHIARLGASMGRPAGGACGQIRQ